jgi:ribA/ribD-fused uncharacterized protein
MIDKFDGVYRFLSNFWPCKVSYEGVIWPSVEHAYQAAKNPSKEYREKILACNTAGKTKALGKRIDLRSDWDTYRLEVMEELLRDKFKDTELLRKLLETGSEELIEGNWWGDTFWGVCRGKGENNLGKLLMKIRKEHEPFFGNLGLERYQPLMDTILAGFGIPSSQAK